MMNFSPVPVTAGAGGCGVRWGKWDLVRDLYRGGLERTLVLALAAQEMPM